MPATKFFIGLDPGISFGWAAVAATPTGEHGGSGTWTLKNRSHEGGGMRLLKLQTSLAEVVELLGGSEAIVCIGYEYTTNMKSTAAAMVTGEWLGAIKQFCELRGIAYTDTNQAVLKRHATGKGNAGKDLMVAAANARWGLTLNEKDNDDEADALWVADWCRHTYVGAVTVKRRPPAVVRP